MSRGRKRIVIDQYKAEIARYDEEVMPVLKQLHSEGKINFGQVQLYSIYDCSYYFWLYGGKPWYMDKKNPCRLYGWAYEETKLSSFWFYFGLFREWAEKGRKFVEEVQAAHSGKGNPEYLIRYLPSGLVNHLFEVYLVDEGKTADQLTMDELAGEVKWFMQKCQMDLNEEHSDETKKEAEREYNRCRTWMKNYYKPETKEAQEA